MKQPTKSSGFTLVELMVTLAIVIILIAVAVPSFRSSTHSTRMTTQVNVFASFLMLARSEAVKRKNTVQVVSQSGDASNEWGGGAQMIDVPTNGVIAVLDPFNGNITVDSDANVTTISFVSRGFVSPAVTGNFDVCETNSSDNGRQFIITATGKTILITRELACP